MQTDQLDDRLRPTVSRSSATAAPGVSAARWCCAASDRGAGRRFRVDGGTGTSAYIDPDRRLAAVLMTQRAMETSRPPEAFVRFWDAVYRGL